MFRLNAPVIIRAKVKEVWNNVAIYSHALPRIHVIGGQRSVRRPCTSRWHLWKSASTEMEDWKSLVVGPLWWGGREGGAILTDLWLYPW